MLRFGIFDHLERRADVALQQQYEERLQLVELADRAGIHCYHVAEHHHSPLCLAPNQAVYLAAVAQRTQRLRFGPLVYVLPLHNPIRLIEEISMLDHLSGGRLQVGVGRGTGGGSEFALWGGKASENDDRFDEALQVVLQGLQCEFLTFHGRYHRYEDLWMELRPLQQPYPPLWWPGKPENAGVRGMHFLGAGPIGKIAKDVAKYLDAFSASQQSRDPLVQRLEEPLYGSVRHLFIADTDGEAMERARSAYDVYRGHYAKPTPEGKPATLPEEGRGPSGLDFDRALEVEALVVGSPAHVREFVRRYDAESGANYFVGAFQWGDLTHTEASHSLELFASEVMPAAS